MKISIEKLEWTNKCSGCNSTIDIGADTYILTGITGLLCSIHLCKKCIDKIKEVKNQNNMKLVCECGNEEIFNTRDEETGKETRFIEDEGQYAKIDNFKFWEAHDTVGIVCKKCGKSIWMFT